MATSSILKEFKVKDINAYSKLIAEINKSNMCKLKCDERLCLDRGNELLRVFVFKKVIL